MSSPPIDHSPPADVASTPRVLIVKTVLGFVAVFGFIVVMAHLFRAELESAGHAFVERFGIWGMALGTLLAESIHFPIPPQFYMLTAITTDTPIVPAMTAICLASLVGGTVSFFTGRLLGNLAVLQRVFARARPRLDPLFERYGIWAIAIGAASPIPFSTLCLVSGMYRIQFKLFVLLVLLRIPRLIAFYFVIRAGWMI